MPGLGTEERLVKFGETVASHKCAGKQVDGCVATTPVQLQVRRDGEVKTLTVYPRYDEEAKRALVGFSYGSVNHADRRRYRCEGSRRRDLGSGDAGPSTSSPISSKRNSASRSPASSGSAMSATR